LRRAVLYLSRRSRLLVFRFKTMSLILAYAVTGKFRG
jgi:hypothetical protein